MTATAFLVELENRPGEMARVIRGLADHGIDVLLAGVTADGERGLVGLMASSEEVTRWVLADARLPFREIPVIFVRAGGGASEAADICSRLAEAGVNIELWLPVSGVGDEAIAAIGVDDAEAGARAVGDLLARWSYA